MLTYSNGYWEVYRRLQGDFYGFFGGGSLGEGVTWEDVSTKELFMGEENFNKEVQDFLALFEKTMKK